jgi:hypothetical protein
VNTYTRSYEHGQHVASDLAGNFFVTWQGETHGGDGFAVLAQRFDAAGARSGTEFVVDEVRLSLYSRVAADPSGSFVVVWDDYQRDGSDFGIMGQRFDSFGRTVGTEFAVNAYTTGAEAFPAIAVGSAGDFVVAWEVDTRSASSYDVVARRFSPLLATGPRIDPIESPVTIGNEASLSGINFSPGSVIMMFVATSSGSASFGPFQPSVATPTSLGFFLDPSIPLANGYATFQVVNTDEDFIESNLEGQLVYGDPTDDIPTIMEVEGVPLGPVSTSVPLAYVEGNLAQGATVALHGSGFNDPVVNVFTASGNIGPLTLLPGGTSTDIEITLPADAATGPGSLQVVNAPYQGNVQSNAVAVGIGPRISIDSVSQSGSTVTVAGAGFSVSTVINFFNRQNEVAINLGGFDANGQPRVPLTLIGETEFRFELPTSAVSGPAFVEALSPPFLPFSSTGDDPDGALTVAAD